MHLSIVCPTPLPPDMGESKAGHCNPNFDPGVRHKQGFVSHICDPGVCHFCIDVSHVNDLGVGQFRCENVNKISFDDACPYKTLTLIMSCHCFEGIKLHFPNISASLCAFFAWYFDCARLPGSLSIFVLHGSRDISFFARCFDHPGSTWWLVTKLRKLPRFSYTKFDFILWFFQCFMSLNIKWKFCDTCILIVFEWILHESYR